MSVKNLQEQSSLTSYATSTRRNSLLAKVLTIASSFFVPFVAVSQGFTAINERLAYIADHIHEQPEVRIKYFVPDDRKSGGAIIEVSGRVKKLSTTDATIILTDGCKIKTSDIKNLSILSVE